MLHGYNGFRSRDFSNMNPLKFNSSKIEEDPQFCKVYKVLIIMRVTPVERGEFSYQLKGIAQICYNEGNEERE